MHDEESRRGALPIPERRHVGITTYDAKDPDSKFPVIEPLRPPEGAPNVLIVLLDDVGFGSSSTFGGPVSTPTADRLAASGLRFNRFHTTALCAPTRAGLLTGRNHHTVGMGSVPDLATSAPGYSSVRPNDCAPLALMLKLNGYSTAQFGKCHEVPLWETSPMGPFDRWPTGSGFESFYGFIGGEANQYYPALYEGTTPVEPPKTPGEGYHLTEDLADRAVAWVRQQKALMPDKPFFLYFAPGAAHAPHHVPKKWSEKYRGAFDEGWDVLRERVLARQKQLGVVPPDTELSARPAEIPAWEEMPAELKPILARQMEVFAGFLEHTDHHVGRLVDSLEQLEVLDDTLIYYIVGDNGSSAEGTPNGTFNELFVFNGVAHLETPEFLASKIDEFGGPEAFNHFAVGWAHATDTPFQWTKQVASHFGGTRNGTIVHWPRGFGARREVRSQFHHVIDVAPTILEVAWIPEPAFVHGIQQQPLHGTSMRYCFDDPVASAQFAVPERGASGVLIAQGGAFGGWSMYLREGIPAYCYNLFGMTRFHVEATDPVQPGTHQLRVEFAYDGGGFGKGGDVVMYLDGQHVGEGRVDATVPMVFSLDETADVGSDTGTTVSDRYTAENSRFTGTIDWIQIDIDSAAADQDHLISPEERLRIAMARQ